MHQHTQSVPSDRVRALLAQMTVEEKVAQLVGFWVDQGDEIVAPMAGEMVSSQRYEDATVHGLGHLTRVYGTRPVDPAARAQWLWAEQRRLTTETRLGIPAIVHEECLTGLAAWKAATFPTPLAWGATFDPDAVETMAAAIGDSMRTLGVHQGLAPVLDVIRDPRWGRVDECISEDPYLVGTIGTAYVKGLQGAGVHATLKHFVGYSGSQAGRNHAPVHAGVREVNDVFLPPFEMAVIDGGVRSVMNSYAEIDGVPVAGSPTYLTDILRDRWGFDGVVVADYFAVGFLHSMHQVAASSRDAALLALAAGIDVELPSGDAYPRLLESALSGDVAELIDRSVLRVLAQKDDLGLLDAKFEHPPTVIDLDSPAHRAIARRLAEESVILLKNNGALPLARPMRIAVVGPNADASAALMGCYSFANHVLPFHPDTPLGFDAPNVLTALRAQFPDAHVSFAQGCEVELDDASGIPQAVQIAKEADVVIAVVGDRAGLFGRGTVGEGNDSESLDLPGVQRQLVEAVVATSTPVVMVALTGRPYVMDWALTGDSAPAAVLQSFFPGEEGGTAIAAIIAGDVNPSGRLPVTLPRSAGAQPYTYLHPALGGPSEVTAMDSTPTLPFGYGLSYTTFEHSDLVIGGPLTTQGVIEATVTVRNTGAVRGADVVQLYARTPYRSTTRPVAQLVGYARIELEAGESAEVHFAAPSGRLAYSNTKAVRVVEAGPMTLWVGASCDDHEATAECVLTGPDHEPELTEPRQVAVTVSRAAVVAS